uniref:General transcription factor IIH subunit 3 n=1 Tax=Hydra vulgaris TaxID=6087 RepID=T2MD04_HYDVU
MLENINDNLLVIILDINAAWWASQFQNNNDVFQKCIDSVLVFCNSYLMLNHTNKLALVVCNSEQACFLYPNSSKSTSGISIETSQKDGKYELFSEMNETLQCEFKRLFAESVSNMTNRPSLLAGALTKALCYIHSHDRTANGRRTNARILIIKGSSDSSSQYMTVMNCIFAASKKNIVIDCCALQNNSGFMQQASDITGGVYFFIDDFSGMLEYLLWIFLPDPGLREKLNLPTSSQIDYRAACFCHKQLVDVGFVCSVCLSIYCQFMPKCATCQTRFKLPSLPLNAKSKKK